MTVALRLLSFVTALLTATAGLSGQTGTLPPDVQKALEARRAEIDRMQKAARDATTTANMLSTMPARLRVEVAEIRDSRSSIGAGSLTIQLAIFTDEIPVNAYVRRLEIASAIDDQGRPILPSTNPGAVAAMQPRGEAPRLMRVLSFQAPPRRTESIKSIDGTLELLVPSEESGSLVKFASLAGTAGKVLEHPTFAKSEIEITSLTKEMYDALKPTWEKSAASVAPPPMFPTSGVFLVKDRGGRFAGVDLRDPSGSALPTNVQTMSTNVLGTSLVVARMLVQTMPPSVEVRFFVAAPAALKAIPFHLENLTLP